MSPNPGRRACLAAALALPFVASRSRAAGTTWSLAIVPQYPAAKLHRDWTPLVDRMARLTGVRLALKLAPDIPSFEKDVLSGGADLAFLNPYHQVMARRQQGFVPLVRDSTHLSGILVVRRDDPIRAPSELEGKELAFPAPNAFGASLWMRALLAEREKVNIRPSYVQTHSNVYRQVAAGRFAAGGGIRQTLAQEREETREAVRVLLETPGVAPHPLSAHPRVPPEVRKAVADTVLQLAADAEGQSMLQAMQMPAPVAADQQRDYAPLERFRLERYVVSSVT